MRPYGFLNSTSVPANRSIPDIHFLSTINQVSSNVKDEILRKSEKNGKNFNLLREYKFYLINRLGFLRNETNCPV
jgi:hypothetical protein